MGPSCTQAADTSASIGVWAALLRRPHGCVTLRNQMGQVEERIRQIADGDSAARLLRDHLSPGAIWAMAQRAEEIRFNDPKAALGVAGATLEAQSRLPKEQRRPRLAALALAVYGSCCRAVAAFEEAEIALTMAARIVPRDDDRATAGVARRLAILRADLGQETQARQLLRAVLARSGETGGRWYGQELTDAAGILIRFSDFRTAARYLEKALRLLPPTGDRFHLAAVCNLARCHLELATTDQELHQARTLIRKAAPLAEPGSFYELRLTWVNGKLLRRLGHLEESLRVLESARAEFDQRADRFDRALLLLDIAELHLERSDPESAHTVALSSFAILSALRDQPDAYRAIMVLYHAALDSALDLPTVKSVRSAVLDARP